MSKAFKLKLRFLILFSFFGFVLSAQQWIQFSQQSHYDTYLSPAAVGAKSSYYAALAHRSQYVGLGTTAIGTQYMAFAMPISERIGVGIRGINDFIGFQRYTDINLQAAYHLPLKKHQLSFGLGVGLIQMGLQGGELRAPDGQYLPGVVIHNDNQLPINQTGGIAPSLAFGIDYSYKGLEVKAAMNHIAGSQIRLNDVGSGTNISIARTINLYSAYVIDLKTVKLKPSFFTKTDFTKWQTQLAIQLDWKKIIAGVGFRGYSGLNNDALIGSFGFKIKNQIQVLYSYDYNLSYLNQFNSGSHEISVIYRLKRGFEKNVKTNIIYNPRYL